MSHSMQSDCRLALGPWGWSDFFERSFSEQNIPETDPGRVVAQHRDAYLVRMERGECSAQIAGGLRHRAASPIDLPGVGDWVVLRGSEHGHRIIVAVLPRRTEFVRRAAGSDDPQVIAANIDVVLVATAAGGDLNARRIERYLASIRTSGAAPVIVVTKADLLDENGDDGLQLREIRAAAGTAPILRVSAVTGEGLDDLRTWITEGQTAAIVGSSGVGKSTLVNRLLGEAHFATTPILETGRGQHTTTRREIVRLPNGGLLLDTPGMREFALFGAHEEVNGVFGEIDVFAADCRFRDCRHDGEPGCAVLAAIESGAIEARRLASFQKLRAETEAFAARQDPRAASETRKAMRARARSLRVLERLRRGE